MIFHPSDLYDADQRVRNEDVRRLAARYRIPHPLPSVRYADGISSRTAGREVRSSWITKGEPTDDR